MSITYINDTVTNSLPYWKQIDDIIQGSDGIKKGGTKYLPIEASENETSYKNRLSKGTFLDSYNPTIDGIAGLIFKNPIQYGDDIPEQSQPFIENADMQGNHFDLLLEDLFKTALNKGIGFAMLDMPKGEATNKKEEQQLGLKPYAVIIQPENVQAWKSKTVNGQIVLTMAKIFETEEVDDPNNPYATKTEDRYRVLEIGTWKVYDKEGTLLDSGETNLDFIPLYGLNLNKKGFFASFPTFYDLFDMNIDHYQIFSDSRHAAHTASVPFYFGSGMSKDDVDGLVISPNTFFTANNEEAKISIVDYDGAGVAVNATLLERIEMKMREIGLSVVSIDKTVTATEVNISSTQSQSKLNGYVRALEDTAELILLGVAKFYGKDEGGSISVDADILSQPLDPQELVALNNMVTAGNLSTETMWKIIGSGTFRMPSDFDSEIEKELINKDGLLNKNEEVL